MSITEEEIIKEIENAFSNREYPGDDKIASVAIGDPTYDGNRVAEYFKGKTWKEIKWQSILASRALDPHAFLYYFTPEGFAYYMPALLIEALDVDFAPDLVESLLNALSPSNGSKDSIREWKELHMSPFNKKELLAIKNAYDYIYKKFNDDM